MSDFILPPFFFPDLPRSSRLVTAVVVASWGGVWGVACAEDRPVLVSIVCEGGGGGEGGVASGEGCEARVGCGGGDG